MAKEKTIAEPKRDIPVLHEIDILVCGGGIAGVAAALAAKRNGASVLLVEREYAVGGLATLGLVTIYLPLCDGRGHQVSFGLAEELLKLSTVLGFEGDLDNPWIIGGSAEEKVKRRYRVRYNPNIYAIQLEQLLLGEGVEILYGTSVCGVDVENGVVRHVIIENKSGRSAIRTGAVVDATGDADICLLTGENTAVFGQGNVPAAWYYSSHQGEYRLKELGFLDIPDTMKTPEQLKEDEKSVRFTGLDADELSRLTAVSHKMLLDEFLKDGMDTPEHALSTMATIPQLRMTRRLSGQYTMDDTETDVKMQDSIGIISDWRKRGPVYEIPFGCLRGRTIKNLLAAGRCISVTDAMWDITRVIPACAVTGQAAGIAGALACKGEDIDIRELQNRLEHDGVILHISQLT